MQLEGFEDLSTILRGGVYALCWRGKVVYVGQSKACLSRIYTHKSNRGSKTPSWVPVKGITFDQVFILPCGPDIRSAVEQEMIAKYRPTHNTHHKPPATVKLSMPPLSALVGNLLPPPAPISENFLRRAL